MLTFSSLKKSARPATLFKIRITGNTVAKPFDGPPRSCGPGEEIVCVRTDADALINSGRGEMLGRVAADDTLHPATEPRVTPIAPFVEAPVPEHYSTLPAIFADAHRQEQRLAKLQHGARTTYNRVQNFSANGVEVEEAERTWRQLKDAERTAHDALREFDRGPLEKALYEAGTALLAEAAAVCADVAELDRTGFAIFKTRIAALELDEVKARSLYVGSAVCLRYSTHAPFAVTSIRRIGGGSRDCYVDMPIADMAATMLRCREYGARIKTLLKEAKAELAKTQRALARAA